MNPASGSAPDTAPAQFSSYQKLVVGMLAFLQFAVILDFMIMAPLGAVIMPAMKITPAQFGMAVSAYAFSAALSGLLTAGFADRFDRKKLLLFFYTGFILGTLWCGLAQSFESLMAARIVTGLFGGVIGSIVLAIATDLFPLNMRGRVMGFIQTAFAASQVLGIPMGLFLSNHWNWHLPFLAMAGMGLVGGLIVMWKMQPVAAHLNIPQEHSPWAHLYHTATNPHYLIAFAAVTLLATGGFMIMPFSSAYLVTNLGIDLHDLPTVYLVTGITTIFVGPLIGRAADRISKLHVFMFGTALSIVMVLIYTHLDRVSNIGLPLVILVNVILFAGIFSRMIPFQALASSVPVVNQRGSFNAISASIQQLSGGLASVVAGHIVMFRADGKMENFDLVGYVVVGTSLVCLGLVWRLERGIKARPVSG